MSRIASAIQSHDVSPFARRPHAPAIERADPDGVLAYVAEALDSGHPDRIDQAYVVLRRAMRSLLHLPDPTV